jgi:hypothetical protein
MTTTRDREQTFARLFRMMDSSFEGEAQNAFRQARRMLQEESASFSAILDHTEHLKDTNTALGEQNRDLHLENERYRSRSGRRVFASTSTWSPVVPAATSENEGDQEGGEVISDPPQRLRFSWTDIPKDVRTLLVIFAIVAVTSVSCHMLASENDPSPKSTSGERGWLTRLPANFSVDRPPWCFSCRYHQDHPVVKHQDGHASSGPKKLPSNFSINRPPWCPACRRQQTQPDSERLRQYGRIF